MADDNEIQARITADNDDLKAKARESADAVKQMAEQMKALTETLDSIREKVVEAFSFAAIVEFTDHFAKLGDEAIAMAAQLGTTVQSVTELQTSFKVMGIEGGLSARQLIVLQRDLSLAVGNSSSVQAKALSNLGVSLDEVKGHLNDGTALLEIMRHAWQDNADGANKLANFQRVFGLSLAQNIPYLIKTDEEMDHVNKVAKETGAAFDQNLARAFSDSGEKLNTFWTSTRGLGESLFTLVKPALDAFFTGLTYIVQSLKEALDAVNNFLATSSSWAEFKNAISDVWTQIKVLDQALQQLFGYFSSGDVGQGFNSFLESAGKIARDTAQEIDDLTTAFKRFGNQVKQFNEARQLKLDQDKEVSALQQSLLRAQKALDDYNHVANKTANETKEQVAAHYEMLKARIATLSEELAKTIETNKQKLLDIEKKYGESDLTIVDQWAKRKLDRYGKLAADLDKTFQEGTHLFGGEGGQMGPEGAGKKEPPPLHIGGGGNHHPPPEFMREWREFLQQKQIAENDFFDKSKEGEQAYWESKLAYVKANSATIVAEYVKSGQSREQADKSLRDLTFQVEQQVFEAKKANAIKASSQKKDQIDKEIEDQKRQRDQGIISETEYYNAVKALRAQWLEYLKLTNQLGTKAEIDAINEQKKVEQDHFKAIADQWKGAVDFITSKFDTMLTGVLQGTQTWEKALKSLFSNMAISFITEVGKMMIKWLAFEAAVALFGKGSNIANAIGNPFSQLLGKVGSMIGSGSSGSSGAGGAVAGAGANAATGLLTKALGKATDATKALDDVTGLNTDATGENSGGILQQIASGIEWIAQALGLTVSTTSNTAAQGSVIAAMALLTEALWANTFSHPPGLAVGAWSIPNDMHAIVHKGEMIIPAREAEMIRSGSGMNFGNNGSSGTNTGAGGAAGGSGGGISVTIQAMDSRSFQTFLNSNPEALTRALGIPLRNGSSGPIYAAGGNNRRS